MPDPKKRGKKRVPKFDPSILDDVPRILAMTPEERLDEVARVSRFIAAARRQPEEGEAILGAMQRKR
jgi:hypothetical protein